MRFDHKKLEFCEISIQSWKTHRRERHNSPPAPARSSAPARKMNRVTMVKSATGTPLYGFEYGGTGERAVQNTYSGGLVSSTRAFLYDREDVIAEFSNDTFATVFRRYIHGPGIDEPLAILGDDVGEYTQYLHDGLGSVTGVVDENGKLGAIDYSAFGETRSNTVKIENRYRYTSREFVETNLYYYRARHMRPDLGRFISMDPLKMIDGTNMFGYVGNDPVLKVDQWGFTAQSESSMSLFIPCWLTVIQAGYDMRAIRGSRFAAGWPITGLPHHHCFMVCLADLICDEDITPFIEIGEKEAKDRFQNRQGKKCAIKYKFACEQREKVLSCWDCCLGSPDM